MLKRKAYHKLETWKKGNSALFLTGARQVGKSFLVNEFGQANFSDVITINLYENEEFVRILENAKSAKDIIFRVSVFAKKPLIANDTLIFFDEIQHAKNLDLIKMAKFLVEEGSYRYIFSGSMLGVSLKTKSWPVGYIEEIIMYPLDFEEFLWAKGYDEKIIDTLRDAFSKLKPVDSYLHSQMMNAFEYYLLVGGLPEAVQTYVDQNDLAAVNIIHRKIDQFYAYDISQYAADERKFLLESIYDLIPQELNSKNKRFHLHKTKQSRGKLENVSDDFIWLKKAGVAITSLNIGEPKSPLQLATNHRLVKVFANDVGLLCYRLMDTDIQMKILAKEKDINFGGIYENFVATELTAHGFKNLFYFNSKKQGEIDFVIEYKGSVLPIEIKSGKDYHRHVALDNVINNQEYQIKEAFVFCNDNVVIKENIVYLPIYLVMFLNRPQNL